MEVLPLCKERIGQGLHPDSSKATATVEPGWGVKAACRLICFKGNSNSNFDVLSALPLLSRIVQVVIENSIEARWLEVCY